MGLSMCVSSKARNNPALALKEYEAQISSEYGDIVIGADVEAETFDWRLTSKRAGWIQMSKVFASAGFSGCRKRRDRGSDHENLVLMFVEDGYFSVSQFKRETQVGPQSMVLMDGNASLEAVQKGPTSGLAFRLPTNLLRAQHRTIQSGCAISVEADRGCAAVLRDLMLSLWSNQEHISPRDMRSIPASLTHLVGLVFIPDDGNGDIGKQAQFDRIGNAIDAELGNPDLSPEMVAEQLGLSRSSLYSSLQWAGTTFSRLVIEKRLEQCRQSLLNTGAADRPILDIALGWGFQSPSHFSRKFAERFGESPSAFRNRMVNLAINAGDVH